VLVILSGRCRDNHHHDAVFLGEGRQSVGNPIEVWASRESLEIKNLDLMYRSGMNY
jgi:hypothetical protein